MSAKRAATTDLNHENWDQEDPADSEQMGTFKTASKDMLEKRVIRTAKRRNQASTEETQKNSFSGFGGFNKPPPPSFDFLANLTNGNNSTNGAGTKSDTAVTSSIFSSTPATAPSTGIFGIPSATNNPAFTVSGTSSFASTATKSEVPTMTFSSSKADSTVSDNPFKIQSVSSSVDSHVKTSPTQVTSTLFGVSSTSPYQKSPETNAAFKQPVSSTSTISQNTTSIVTQSNSSKEPPVDKEAETEKARNRYYSRLKGLNEAVSSWIVKHVEMTPLCFLSPIFKDYENYLKEIQEEYEAAKAEIEAKIKQQNSEVKPIFSAKVSGSSLFSNKSTSFTEEAKTNQPFGANPSGTATNTGVFGQSASFSKSQNNATQSSLFGKTETASQGITFGAKPTESESETPVSSPNKGFSFGSTSTPTSSAFAANPSSAGSPSKGFSFMSSTAATSPNASLFSASGANSASPPKGFAFGMTTAATSPSTSTAPAPGAAPFSFGIGSGTPFSFSSQTQNSTTTTTEQNEEEDDQPPKVEFTPVVEENSVFDQKCKIFVKKDGNFADKGVGTLYIKKIEESGKHQLLVRANTNLGTVLLNLILSASVPTQRTGKNNVMLVCIPTAEAKSPTPVLIRVKTSEEADELLEILNKYKS